MQRREAVRSLFVEATDNTNHLVISYSFLARPLSNANAGQPPPCRLDIGCCPPLFALRDLHPPLSTLLPTLRRYTLPSSVIHGNLMPSMHR